jgi:uncharacterized protein involved in exopolysaccharide biosynthesis
MKRYIQTFMRHKVLLAAPIIISLIVGLGFVLKQPKTYVATGTLWADSPLPSDSSIVSGGTSNPAAAEASVLTELLYTRDFLGKIAARIGVGDSSKIGKGISVSVPGPQVIGVSVKGKNPARLAKVDKAVEDEFIAEMVGTRTQRAQALAAYYQQQVNSAGKSLNDAKAQFSQYLAAHPSATSAPGDPLTQLANNVALAQDQYNAAVDSYSKAGLDLSHISDTVQLSVIDQPILPTVPQSRKKRIVLGGLGGLLAGAVISFLTMLVLVGTDRSARRETEIEDALGLRVVGAVKQFSARQSHREVS